MHNNIIAFICVYWYLITLFRYSVRLIWYRLYSNYVINDNEKWSCCYPTLNIVLICYKSRLLQSILWQLSLLMELLVNIVLYFFIYKVQWEANVMIIFHITFLAYNLPYRFMFRIASSWSPFQSNFRKD